MLAGESEHSRGGAEKYWVPAYSSWSRSGSREIVLWWMWKEEGEINSEMEQIRAICRRTRASIN